VSGSDAFDFVKGGMKHKLYVEVTPISFNLKVRRGTALSQLRLYKGRDDDVSPTMEELYNEDDDNFPVVDEHGQPYRQPCADRPDDIWFPLSKASSGMFWGFFIGRGKGLIHPSGKRCRL
jgi:hypothetical protein